MAAHLKNLMEAEREGGKDRQALGPSLLPCLSLTLSSRLRGCVGTVGEQRAGYMFSFVSLCSVSGKIIALDLSFLFCTIRVEIP